MTTRRTFMQIATATAALVGVPAYSSSGRKPELVLSESSFDAANLFARRAQTSGVPTSLIHEGDITDVWLTSVRPLWQRKNSTIAGLTTPAALFCLEQLAQAQGLRVVFHAEHVLLADGRVDHQVQRTATPFSAAALTRAQEHWPKRLADSLMQYRQIAGYRPGHSLAALAPTLPEGAQLLTSWIIA